MNEMNLDAFRLSTHFKTHFRRVFADNKTFKAQLKANEFYHVMMRTATETVSKYFNEDTTQVYTEHYLANTKGELFRVYYLSLCKFDEKVEIIDKGIEAVSYEKVLTDLSLFQEHKQKLSEFYEISKIFSIQSHLQHSLPLTPVQARKRKI